MKNKWDYSGVADMVFGCFESYERAAMFLGDTVEDWGCGTGWAKRYFKNYKGIDGSPSHMVKETVDLTEYTSGVDNILMRQVLEANIDWRKILENVRKSFRKKFCLIVYTPEAEKTHIHKAHPVVLKDGTIVKGEFIHEMWFNRQDIMDYFPEGEFITRQENLKNRQGYGNDWFLYVERK
jgi:hypothetical protein